jgi:hypothetical protein
MRLILTDLRNHCAASTYASLIHPGAFTGYNGTELQPPLVGKFENGIGTFFADDTFNGQAIRVRFIWNEITEDSARWEQAFSPDGGATWEVNWVMWFKRMVE